MDIKRLQITKCQGNTPNETILKKKKKNEHINLFLLQLATHGRQRLCDKMSIFSHSTLTDPVWDQLVFQVEVPRAHLVSVHIAGHVSEDHFIMKPIPVCVFGAAAFIVFINVNRFYLKPC